MGDQATRPGDLARFRHMRPVHKLILTPEWRRIYYFPEDLIYKTAASMCATTNTKHYPQSLPPGVKDARGPTEDASPVNDSRGRIGHERPLAAAWPSLTQAHATVLEKVIGNISVN
ncbi:hypothetical protein ANO14919_090890 [Xylariales sp. No.14919]|nr:hypothetical protein ANO14919_090890 [Xylariales sp. No.14919]